MIRSVMDERIPLIFCVDVEPDEHTFPVDAPSSWAGFEYLAEASVELRNRITAVTGEPARFTWALRIDPQIADSYGDPAWIVDQHRGFFDDALENGDAIGVHPHAWRWDLDRSIWVADHEDADWVDHCLEMSVEGFQSRFGRLPAYHRYGARFMSSRVMQTAERLGMRIDLTLEPGEEQLDPGEHLGGIMTGGLPDFGAIPREPYQPDRTDYRRAASDRTGAMWTIPLSAGHPTPGRRSLDRLKHPARSARGLGRRVRRTTRKVAGTPLPRMADHRTLRLWGPRPDEVWDQAFASLDAIPHRYLAFGVRSDMHHAVVQALEVLLPRPEASNLVFTTPEDTLARLGLLPEIQSETTSRN